MATSRLDYGFTEFYWEGEVIILLIEAPAESAGLLMVPGAGVEPARYIIPRDFKSLVSTNFTTRAFVELLPYHGGPTLGAFLLKARDSSPVGNPFTTVRANALSSRACGRTAKSATSSHASTCSRALTYRACSISSRHFISSLFVRKYSVNPLYPALKRLPFCRVSKLTHRRPKEAVQFGPLPKTLQKQTAPVAEARMATSTVDYGFTEYLHLYSFMAGKRPLWLFPDLEGISPQTMDIAVRQGMERLKIPDLVNLKPDIRIAIDRSPAGTTQTDHLIIVFFHSIKLDPCNVVFNRVGVRRIMTHNYTNDIFS